MKPSTFCYKIGLATIMATMAGGCAARETRPIAIAEPVGAPPPFEFPLDNARATEVPALGGTVSDRVSWFVVHIDPTTGQILPKPPVVPPGHELQLFQTAPPSAPQALEVPSPTPGGGVMVNLNRQFHTPLVATVDQDGKIKFEHRASEPSSGDTK
jgi:hypothetical protein